MAWRKKTAPQGRQKLVDFLTPEEKKSAEENRYVVLRGSAGGRYRIDLAVSENVHRLDSAGFEEVSYCVGIPVPGPHISSERYYDDWKEACWIAQYLTIKNDEFGFLEEANEI